MKTNKNLIPYETLTPDLKGKVREALMVYGKCDLEMTFTMEFKVTTGTYIAANYNSCWMATYTADEVFTLDEQIENYATCFHSFHPKYKGIRDYGLMRNATSETEFKLVDGNLQIA